MTEKQAVYQELFDQQMEYFKKHHQLEVPSSETSGETTTQQLHMEALGVSEVMLSLVDPH